MEEYESLILAIENSFGTYDTPLPPEYFKNSKFNIISTVAYLLGVPESKSEKFLPEVYESLELNRHARIIKNLCCLRTAFIRNNYQIYNSLANEMKSITSLPDLIPIECITQLSSEGIVLKPNQKINQYMADINRYISDRINNIQNIFPLWLNWNYIREIFIMPNGLSEVGVKSEASLYQANKSYYPYQHYLNWLPSDNGNILYNDEKFVTLLYSWNDDVFTDLSKLRDASTYTKDCIYDFIDESSRVVFVVDCENSDPYKLCATLNNLDRQYLDKISKIILYDDINTTSAWRILNSYMSVPVEYILIERIKNDKSLVDMRLAIGVCRESFQNDVDSFVLVSSDSDYWALISALPESNFLVMAEHGKTGPDIKNALNESDIFFCYLDDFYSGNSYDIRVAALLSEMSGYLHQHVRANVNNMVEIACRSTRVEMSDAEYAQFYAKYIKSMYLEIDESGDLLVRFKN